MGERTRYGINDEHALVAAARGELTADPDTGHVNYRDRPCGRARRDGYITCSIRRFGTVRWVSIGAHRVVWLVLCGPIPPGMVVNHRNGRRWDNRLDNLEVLTPTDNMRHGRGLPYAAAAHSGDDNTVTVEWLARARHAASSGTGFDDLLPVAPVDSQPFVLGRDLARATAGKRHLGGS